MRNTYVMVMMMLGFILQSQTFDFSCGSGTDTDYTEIWGDLGSKFNPNVDLTGTPPVIGSTQEGEWTLTAISNYNGEKNLPRVFPVNAGSKTYDFGTSTIHEFTLTTAGGTFSPNTSSNSSLFSDVRIDGGKYDDWVVIFNGGGGEIIAKWSDYGESPGDIKIAIILHKSYNFGNPTLNVEFYKAITNLNF